MTPDELARMENERVSDEELEQAVNYFGPDGFYMKKLYSAFLELQARRAADRNVLRHWSDGYRSGYGFSKAISELLP